MSDVRVADGEMCAIPAANNALEAEAAAPDVAGPITATSRESAIIFWATTRPSPGPFSTGVSPSTSCTLSPSGLASVETAYRVQESCSWPRNPAPPVSGVMIPIFSVPLQLTACVLVTPDEPAPAVDASAAATIVASASTTPPRPLIRSLLG